MMNRNLIKFLLNATKNIILAHTKKIEAVSRKVVASLEDFLKNALR